RLKDLCQSEIVEKPVFPQMRPYTVSASSNNLTTTGASAHESLTVVEPNSLVREEDRLEDIQARCTEEMSGPEFYQRLSKYGVQYEAGLQAIERICRRDGEALGEVRLLDALEPEIHGYEMHPALLDACLQVLWATLPTNTVANSKDSLYMPVGLRSLRVYKRPGSQVWSHALLHLGS